MWRSKPVLLAVALAVLLIPRPSLAHDPDTPLLHLEGKVHDDLLAWGGLSLAAGTLQGGALLGTAFRGPGALELLIASTAFTAPMVSGLLTTLGIRTDIRSRRPLRQVRLGWNVAWSVLMGFALATATAAVPGMVLAGWALHESIAVMLLAVPFSFTAASAVCLGYAVRTRAQRPIRFGVGPGGIVGVF